MKGFRFYITIALIVAVTVFFVVAVTAENKETSAPTVKQHVKIETQNEKHGAESIKGEHEKEGKEGAKHAEAEEEEEESAWRVPGWQTIFAILAVGYYIALSLNFLPKLATKDLEEHH